MASLPVQDDMRRGPRFEPLPRAACTDPADFLRRFVAARTPVILTGLVTRWPAYGRWTPDYFKERFPNVTCKVSVNLPTQAVSYEKKAADHLQEMSLSQFVDYMKTATAPCYYRRQHANKLTGIENDVSLDELTPGYRADTDFMWIGSAGTRTGLHFDTQDNVLCQLYGTKDLWLAAPSQSKHLYTYPASVTKSRVAPDRPDLNAFPDLDKVTFLHGTLDAGECIYIPNRWWHSVISTSISISVSHEFGQKISWGGLASAVNAGGLRSWMAVSRDFLNHGVLGRPFERRLADDPPFGRVLYDLVRGSARRARPKAAA
jgi:lysine-specific demethylase 8